MYGTDDDSQIIQIFFL